MRDMNEKFFVEILSKMIALDDIEDSVKNINLISLFML